MMGAVAYLGIVGGTLGNEEQYDLIHGTNGNDQGMGWEVVPGA